MVPSSALCRAQESLNLRKAADTDLENVRRVATEAAAAWGKEALAAEKREERQEKGLPFTRAIDGLVADPDAHDEPAAHENTDRGQTTAADLS